MDKKVNKDDMIEMFRMRLDGYSLEEIGEKFGVSRQYVWAITGTSEHFKSVNKAIRKVIYPSIVRWMRERGVSITDLSRQC